MKHTMIRIIYSGDTNLRMDDLVFPTTLAQCNREITERDAAGEVRYNGEALRLAYGDIEFVDDKDGAVIDEYLERIRCANRNIFQKAIDRIKWSVKIFWFNLRSAKEF